ncbi:MAG: substrate-binding domain-containing protein [Hasllibacter sp.]
MRRVLAAFAALFTAAQACAEERVVLLGPTGLRVEGEIVGRDGRFLRVATATGVVTADGELFECRGAACPDAPGAVPEVRMAVEAALAGVVVPALIEAFASSRDLAVDRLADAEDGVAYILSDARDVVTVFRVGSGTNADGLAALAADEAQLVLTTRTATPRERGRAEDAGSGDPAAPARGRVIGLAGLVPIVDPASGIGELSLSQLAALFAGEVTDWSEVGGRPGAVRLHLPMRDSGAEPAFIRMVMAASGLALSERITRHPTEDALVAAVASDPGAIGIATAGRPLPVEVPDIRTACGPRLRATREAIRSGDWPLTVPVVAYLSARPVDDLVRDFLRFALSSRGQLVVRRAGLVDLAPTRMPIASQGERFAGAVLALDGAEGLARLQAMVRRLRPLARLGTTFRFAPGGVDLDPASREAAIRLAVEIAEGRIEGPLVLVGFSDGAGTAMSNERLARRRAERAAAAIRAAIPEGLPAPVIEVESFGETMPVACDDTPWGRRLNRRVEVWVD